MPREFVKEYFDAPASWQETLLPYQVQMQRDIVRLIPKDVKTLLDAGCGNGLITNVLPKHLEVTGLDRSKTALADVKWPTQVGDVTDLPFPDQSFDLVMCNDVIEHLDEVDRQQAVRELARVSRRYLMISVPFRENLLQNTVRCAGCQQMYHINHHLHSFGLQTVPDLLADTPMRCFRQVLSGDCWQRDPPAVIALRRYLGLEYPPIDYPVCTTCGNRQVEVPRGNEKLRGFLDWAAAGLFLQFPELIDYSNTRTECINLFLRSDSDTTIPLSASEHEPLESRQWQAEDDSGAPVSLTEMLCPVDRIDFSQADLYVKEWLPRSGYVPYAVTTESTGSPQLITQGTNLFCGFFQLPGQPGEAGSLEIAGYTHSPAEIDLSVFDEVKSYRHIKRVTVDGDFRVHVPCTPLFSRYGHLIKFEGRKGLAELRSVRLCRGSGPTARILRNTTGDIQFLTQQRTPELSVSLPVYGNYVDVESVFAAAAVDSKYPKDNEILNDNESIHKYLTQCLEQIRLLKPLAPHESFFHNSLKTLQQMAGGLARRKAA